MKNKEVIEKDLNSIYIGNLNTVDSDLCLQAKGENGSIFTWESGEERFIENNGTVHRPLYGMGNRDVTLTVRAAYEGESEERTLIATVLQQEKKTVVTDIYPVHQTTEPGTVPRLPSVVIVRTEDGRETTVPVTWDSVKPMWEEGSVRVEGVLEGTIEKCDKKAEAIVTFSKCQESGQKKEKILHRYPISSVGLKEGTLYWETQQNMLKWLLAAEDDQMLYNFRKAAGLDTHGAKPMTGWDAESCNLKGHTTGHYLSGLSLAWAATGDRRFLKKIRYMVQGLKVCQDALGKREDIHPGFLSAYDEKQFDLLEAYVKYPDIWAPYYTLDKIMAGLEDCYLLAGEQMALEILSPLGDWVYTRLSRLSREQREKMWSMYIAGEFGGMPGTMAQLYQITGKSEYLQAAEMFYNEKLYYPMKLGYDTLEDMHANQHIPQIISAMKLYEATGEMEYYWIGEHFWGIVTAGHIYCIGGTGETEMFHRAGTICDYLTEKSAESCASYNMLRLTGQIFQYRPEGRIMEYYENTLCNHIMASCSHEADGGTTYFMPLCPGGVKEYSTTENTCCHGTGMESRFRYMEDIYTYDDQDIFVNLLIDSVLSGDENLELTTNMGMGQVDIRCNQDMKHGIRIRVPSWAAEEVRFFKNGRRQDGKIEEGYVRFAPCHEKDVIRMEVPVNLRILENKENRDLVNLACGPYLLAAISDSRDFLKLPPLEEFQPEDVPFHFIAGGLKFIPFQEVDQEPAHLYFLR